MNPKNKIAFGVIFVALGVIFLFLSRTGLARFDLQANDYFVSSIKKAAVSYALIRSVNSVVSVVKESSIQVSPAGVGLEFAFGQILDPIDDMTERVSNVLVVAIVALGIEKIIFELSNNYFFSICGAICFLIALFAFFSIKTKFLIFLGRILASLLVIRLLLPASAFVSNLLYENLFAQKIQSVKAVLHLNSSVESFSLQSQKNDSFFSNVTSGFDKVKNSVSSLKKTFYEIKNNAGKIIDALIELTICYIFVFLINVVFLPVFGFFVIYKGIGTTFKE